MSGNGPVLPADGSNPPDSLKTEMFTQYAPFGKVEIATYVHVVLTGTTEPRAGAETFMMREEVFVFTVGGPVELYW